MSSYAGLSVFYADDGHDWARYLCSKLGSKDYAIHSELNNMREDPNTHTRSTIVNTFLMSPDFLDLDDWDIMKEFNPKTSIAILTGIDFKDLKKEAKKKECKEVLGWLIYELTDSNNEKKRNESVRDMLLMIVAAYEGALQDDRVGAGHLTLRRTVSAMDRGSRATHAIDHQSPLSPQSDYDFLPPKRQVNGLHTCVVRDDRLFVILHRAAEGKVQLEFSDGSITPADIQDPACVLVFLYHHQDHSKSFHITLDGSNIGGNKDISRNANTSESSRHSDSYTDEYSAIGETPKTDTKFEIPLVDKRTFVDVGVQTDINNDETVQLDETDRSSAITEEDHVTQSSKLDQIYDLLKDELDPEEMLCRCMGIAKDTNVLDEKMKSMIEGMEVFKHISYPVQYEPIEDRSSSTWPTLLHFGAQYNLLNFCDALLSNPLMHGACLTRNKDNDYPHDVARRHGHTELSVLLKHFSTYVSGVTRDGLYDSGFSGGTPRLSTITLYRDSRDSQGSIPRPHHSRDASRGYTRMGSELLGEAISELTAAEEEESRQAARHKLTKDSRTISDDVGFDEDDEDFDTIAEDNRASSSPSNNSGDESGELFGNLLTYSPESSGSMQVVPRRVSENSITSNESKSSFYLDEEESGEFTNRKNIRSFLGTEETHSTPPEKKGFFGLFSKKKKIRSSSESSLTVVSEKSKVYKRGSNRSSSTSTSSGSSTNLHETKGSEDTPVQYRDADAQKSKNKLRLFMSKAKAERRKSIRMKNVLEDQNMSGPTLPPRRRQIQETF